MKEVSYKASGTTKVIFNNGKAKYDWACIIKSNIQKLNEDNVSLRSGDMKWIGSNEVKTMEQLNADNTVVLTENGNGNFQNFG